MGPRLWATIGNMFKIYAVLAFLTGIGLGYQAFQGKQLGLPGDLPLVLGIFCAITFACAFLFWNIKGPLIRGNVIARVLFGGWVLLAVITSLGFYLIFVGIVYLFTSEPAAYDYYGMFGNRDKEPKPRFKAPTGWYATGKVGPSGAMLYNGPGSGDAAGIFDSFTPVQVVDKQGGYARVVAASGQGGWIDMRTLSEGA